MNTGWRICSIQMLARPQMEETLGIWSNRKRQTWVKPTDQETKGKLFERLPVQYILEEHNFVPKADRCSTADLMWTLHKQWQMVQVEQLQDEHPSRQRTACKQSPPQHPYDTVSKPFPEARSPLFEARVRLFGMPGYLSKRQLCWR